MKTSLKIALLSLIGVIIGCQKDDFDDDFGGSGRLRGRLVYADRFVGTGTQQPVVSRVIRLALSPSDKINFKYSVTTDKDGYFLFEHLNAEQEYDLIFSDTLRRIRYSAFKTTKPSNDAFLLAAENDTLTQNGYVVSLRDNSPSGTGAVVANASLCVFTNRQLAFARTCTGSTSTVTTDAFGRAVQYNLRPGTYYFFGTATLATRNFRVLDSVEVKPIGITRKTLSLLPFSGNGFDLTVTDGRPAPATGVLANAQVCIFNSAILARADTCAGSIQTLLTGPDGHLRLNNLTPQRYYFRIRARYGSLALKGYDSLDVQPTGITFKTIALVSYSSRRNGFVLNVTDARATPLPRARVCMFTSAILARADTCAGSIRQFSTDANGQVPAYNLVPRRYYFRIRGQYGGLTLLGYDSLDVQISGITTKSVYAR